MGKLTDKERADVAAALARIEPDTVFELRSIMPGWTSKTNEARRDFGMRFKADYDAGVDLGVVVQLKNGQNHWRYKKSGLGVEAWGETIPDSLRDALESRLGFAGRAAPADLWLCFREWMKKEGLELQQTRRSDP